MFRLMLETATRRVGCINLRLEHLDSNRQSIWLRQKSGKYSEFPASNELLADLRAFATSRGSAQPGDPVLRQKGRCRRTGQVNPALTARCFDRAGERIQETHEWAQLGGRPCKMRILDHEPNGHTELYGRATFEQLAWAVAQMTGSPHPLAERPPWIAG